MAGAQVFLAKIERQRWPVVKVPEELLTPEEKATQTGSYTVAVLAVERNELHWIDPYELVEASSRKIFDLRVTACRDGNEDLQHACKQIMEHETLTYWIQQYRSYQMAMHSQYGASPPLHTAELPSVDGDDELELVLRLSKEEYQRKTTSDQVNAGPSGTKRTRSSALETDMDDDRHSLPPSAKKSRKDDKTSSTGSSESSITLKDDSQSSKSSPNMERPPLSAEVRRLRDMGFMNRFSTHQQNEDGKNESVVRQAEIVPVSSSSASSVSPPAKPRPFFDTLANSTTFDEQKLEIDKTKKPMLECPTSRMGFQAEVWTVEQDAELLRLKERVKPTPSWLQIRDLLKKKFPDIHASRPNEHYDNVIKEGALTGSKIISASSYQARKAALAFLDKHEVDQSDDSDSEESEAEEVREDWIQGSSAVSSSTPWTTLEDAELLCMRERKTPTPSWQETADALNETFRERTADRPRTRDNVRHRFRYLTGNPRGSKAGTASRKAALALLDDCSSSSMKSKSGNFSTEDDIELVKLREEEMPGAAWVEVAEMFNSRMHVRPGYQARKEGSLYGRFELIRSKWRERGDGVSITMLEFVQDGGMLVNSSRWTSAQDDALAKFKKDMSGKSWFEVAKAFNNYGEKKGWPVRSSETIMVRFNKHLRVREDDQQIPYCTSTSSASVGSLRLWTPMEDKELLRLKKSMPDKTWIDVAMVYNHWLRTKGSSERSSKSLSDRYRRLLLRDKKLPLGVVADSSSTLSDSMPYSKAWTSPEDAELLRLRKKMPHESWSKVAAALMEQNRGRGWKERSSQSLCAQYELLMQQEKLSKQPTVIIIDDHEKPISLAPLVSRKFTAEEDGELIRLRKNMGDSLRWSIVADDFNKKFSHSPRSMSSLKSRYLDFLQDDAPLKPGNGSQRQNAVDELQQKGIERLVKAQESKFDSMTLKNFTAEEDSELILLTERFRGTARWGDICRDYNAKMPDVPRSPDSLSTRYRKFLQETAFEQLQGGENMRERALAVLRKRGIELQVDDPISDSSSEDDEDGAEDYDESSEEEDDDDEPEDKGTQVTILIGKENTPFTVPLSRIETNRYFLDDEYEEPTGGHIIQGHRWKSIKPKDFTPIHDFILHNEFDPHLDPSRKSLIGITTDAEHSTQLLRCAQVFVLARQLLMWDLAALAISKFKLLKKGAIYLLKAAELVFSEPVYDQEVDRMMRALLVEEVMKRYWDLVVSQPTNMQEVMKKSPLFEVALYERKIAVAKEKYDKMEWN
ncbi:hypothetical protein FKW77_002323 [Venturia effusa]|uniref:Myb-like domain-containing protein n=1 Tax=Venturia effusa TaxID=50376 RepID=A0A517LI98_9PEZI|nr:hypothetical protein FKW77_002323 [Venturia effusa]